jgi:hypothetical protein
MTFIIIRLCQQAEACLYQVCPSNVFKNIPKGWNKFTFINVVFEFVHINLTSVPAHVIINISYLALSSIEC